MKRISSIRQAFSWQPNRNIWANLGTKLKRVLGLREGGLTQGWIRSVYHFGRYVESMVKSQGWRGVVIHLKGCHVLLQQIVGGQKLDNPRLLGCAIGRSRTGLPRVIPYAQRVRILNGDVWAVRIWSSLFWLYRVIEIRGSLKIRTITSPGKENYLVILEWARFLSQFLPVFLEKIGMPDEAKSVLQKRRSILKEDVPLLLGLTWNNIQFCEYLGALLLPSTESFWKKVIPRKEWKTLQRPLLMELQPRPLLLLNSGPNSAKGPDEGPGPNTRTSTGSILSDLLLWKLNEHGLFVSLRNLWAPAAAFAQTLMVRANDVFEQMTKFGYLDQSLFTDVLYRRDPSIDSVWRSSPLPGFSYARTLGKLSFIPEPAGKIRVVAMVDSLTQMLLRPLHDAVFGILRKIPQDGTFDQIRPARLLAGHKVKTLWSYDLSAATDRFPASLQQVLLGYLIGPRVARAWREVLTSREFMIPRVISDKQRVPHSTPRKVRYMAGQPMGAYTSWAVFALSHHLLVQFAAYQAFGTLKWFEIYCLLGDDVVIGNEAVAEKYLLLLRAIGVEVGLAKSLISRRGVFEFAKRTFRITDEGILVDLSGVSLAAIAAAVTDSSVMEDLLSRANVRSAREGLLKASRVLGLGYKVRSSIGGDLAQYNTRLLGLLVLLTRPASTWGLTPVEWLLQVTAEVRGIISNDDMPVILDAIRQRLVDSAMKIAENRLRFLLELNAPMPDEEIQTPKRMPWAIKGLGTPLYREFLREWVFKPIQEQVSRDVRELLVDLKEWQESTTNEGDFSLDEIYTKLNQLNNDLSTFSSDVSPFIRRNTEKSDSRRETRRRSRTVRFWKATRRVVLRFLEK